MFHDDPMVDRILTDVNTKLGLYAATHKALTESENDVNFSAWKSAITAEEYSSPEYTALLDSTDDMSAEAITGMIDELQELLTVAKARQKNLYYAKSDRTEPDSDVDLSAMRETAKKTLNAAIMMAETGTFDGLTVDIIKSLPNVKSKKRQVKNSKDTYDVWDLPKAPNNERPKWSGVRSNNSKMKFVLNGEIPADHPDLFGDACSKYFGMDPKGTSKLFDDWKNRNKKDIYTREVSALDIYGVEYEETEVWGLTTVK